MLIENYLGCNLNYFSTMTYHASVERKERINGILNAVGEFGTVVATIYQEHLGTCKHLTDMGIIVVTDAWCERLVTAWIPDELRPLRQFFMEEDGSPAKSVPVWMAARIAYAQKKEKQRKQKRVRYHAEEDEAC